MSNYNRYSTMYEIVEKMENFTQASSTHFGVPNSSVDKEFSNSTEDLSVKKNNSVISSSIMFSFGVLSNVLALLVLHKSPTDQKRKLFYRLVAGLTFTDLFGTTATSPVVIAVYTNDFRWIGGAALCKYFGFMMIFSGIATTTIVCLMAVERLICIRHPYLYHAQLRKKHATYFLLSAWIFAGLIASLPLMGFGEIVLQYPYTWCFFDYYTSDVVNRGFNYLFAITALLTISITVTCNGIVLYTLFRTKMRGMSRKNKRESRTFTSYSRRYAECQMAVLLIGITVVFSTCYLPLMIRIVINQSKIIPVDNITDLLTIRLASLNQILDPWVYILLRREAVWKVANTLKKLCPKESKENEIRTFRRLDSSVLKNNVQYTCCVFCWHCLCDPPQTQRPNSSANTDLRRHSLNSGSNYPASKLSLHMMNSVILTGPASNYSDSAESRRRSEFIKQLQKQSSVDTNVVAEQPTYTPCVNVYTKSCNQTRERLFSDSPLLEMTQEDDGSSGVDTDSI